MLPFKLNLLGVESKVSNKIKHLALKSQELKQEETAGKSEKERNKTERSGDEDFLVAEYVKIMEGRNKAAKKLKELREGKAPPNLDLDPVLDNVIR